MKGKGIYENTTWRKTEFIDTLIPMRSVFPRRRTHLSSRFHKTRDGGKRTLVTKLINNGESACSAFYSLCCTDGDYEEK